MVRTFHAGFLRATLIALAATNSACVAEVADSADFAEDDLNVDAVEQALVTSSFTMSNAYWGMNGWGICSSGNLQDLQGYEPSDAGTYPVFIFLNGTGRSHNEAGALVFAQEMAARGFVAASVEYSNATYPGTCTAAKNKARCVFDARSSSSAVSKLCGRARADCSKGVVVSGFSQGANLSSLAKNFDSRVSAGYFLGHGYKPTGGFDLSACMKDSATTLPANRTRSVNGEHDQYFGKDAAGVRTQLQIVTGVSCPSSYNCLQTDGSGWYMVSDAQENDGLADHRYFFIGGPDGTSFDPTWRTGSAPWSLKTNLDWLASKVSK